MIALCKLIWYGLIGLFRSRASLEIEILVLRHQLNILRRSSPSRPILGRIDRTVFVGLYGLARSTRRDISFVTEIPHMGILWSGDFDQWEFEIVRPGRDHHGRTDIVKGDRLYPTR